MFSFTTQDNIGPTVQGTSPRSGTTDIGVSDDIGITFNEDIDEAAMQQDWVTVTGGVSGQVTMAGNRTIVFTPNSDLAAETLHTVTVSASVVDMAGNGLAAPYARAGGRHGGGARDVRTGSGGPAPAAPFDRLRTPPS